MKVRPTRDRVLIEADPGAGKYVVKQEPNWADHVMVSGARYQPTDVKSIVSNHLGKFTSGIMSNLNEHTNILESNVSHQF